MTSNTDPMIDRLIDGRYRVRSRIARGGMATVYLATDLRLDRRVAVKIMHGHLADDSQYREKFVQEARSAARLAHPNVVNVYDQGQDDDTAYLVMEYLPGITLRDLLQEHRILTTDQTFDIMEAVLSGLAAAHQNGIVHRDLKPENVLLADDGRIKIGDFGLARAATASTATGNALLGTIAYLSPELVTRGIADARSDIYAVGIMLFEVLAGEQPFKGEQPFQIAHQHANESVRRPSALNPDVPRQLDELVLWATSKDPERRPRDARVMLDELVAVQAELVSERSTYATAPQTRVFPTAVSASSGGSVPLSGAAPAPAGAPAPASAPVPAAAAPAPLGATRLLTAPVQEHSGEVPDDSARDLGEVAGRRRRRGWMLLALVLLLATVAGGTGWYFGVGPGARVSVPEVAGGDLAAATDALTAAELVVGEPTRVFDPVAPVDSVVGSSPTAGSEVAKQTTVTLLLSQGPEQLPVPAIAGLTEQEARDQIAAARFEPAESQSQFDSEVEEGRVIRALAADGTELTAESRYGDRQPVTLVLSRGAVPEVAGEGLDDAIEILQDAELVGVEGPHSYSSTVPEGVVLSSTQVGDGPAVVGTEFELAVSDGPAPVAVPDLRDLSREEATAALAELGLKVSYNPLFAPFAGARVTGTNPEAGTLVEARSTVNLFLVVAG